MTDFQFYAGVVVDVGVAGSFVALAGTARTVHQPPYRRRVVVWSVVVVAILSVAVILRVAGGAGVPIWYVPVYASAGLAMAYVLFVHIWSLTLQMRSMRQRVAAVQQMKAAARRDAHPAQVQQP